MDESLANAVLQRQSFYVGDFMNRIVMLEAKLLVLEKELATLKEEKTVESKTKKPS